MADLLFRERELKNVSSPTAFPLNPPTSRQKPVFFYILETSYRAFHRDLLPRSPSLWTPGGRSLRATPAPPTTTLNVFIFKNNPPMPLPKSFFWTTDLLLFLSVRN